MKTLTIKISDEEFKVLDKRASDAGFSSVPAYMMTLCGFDSEAYALAARAFSRLINVATDKIFLMKDLFTAEEWKREPLHVRVHAGRMFKIQILNDGLQAKCISKETYAVQRYQKCKGI